MKFLQIFVFAFISNMYFMTSANADPSGGGGDLTLQWYCSSLDTVGSNYQSFCSAYSPNATLYEIQLHNQIYGWSSSFDSYNCYGLGSYLDGTDDTTNAHNSSDFVSNAWQYAGPGFSYDDELNGVLLWWFSSDFEDNDGADRTFTNTKGPCY